MVFALTTRLMVARGKSPGKQFGTHTPGFVTVAAGVAELVGNVVYIIMAPKTEILIGVGQGASRGVGLTIAAVAGVVLIISGVYWSRRGTDG